MPEQSGNMGRTRAIFEKSGDDGKAIEQMAQIGKRLAIFAKEKFGSKTTLINKLEISSEEAIQYFSYKKPLSKEILGKLSRLGCDLDWLITGESKNIAPPPDGRELRAKQKTESRQEPPVRKAPPPEAESREELKELAFENYKLRLKLKDLETEIDRLKNNSGSPPPSGNIHNNGKTEKEIMAIIQELRNTDANNLKLVLTKAFAEFQKIVLTSITSQTTDVDKIKEMLKG